MSAVQEAVTGYRRRVEELRQVETDAEEARDSIHALHQKHDDPEAARVAQIAVRLAELVRSGWEQNADIFDILVRENKDLRHKVKQLLARKGESTVIGVDDEREDDDRSFGTHIREAISLFRGR